jgi:hypothetical protein
MSRRSVKLRQAQEVRDDIRITKGAGYRIRYETGAPATLTPADLRGCMELLTVAEYDAWRRLTPGTWELAFRAGWRSV